VRKQTEQARRRLLWQALALVPISLALAFLFTLLLARPIRDLDRSIRELGHGRLDQPVRVRGPVDLEALAARSSGCVSGCSRSRRNESVSCATCP